MISKFIVDSVVYWAKEYHIDGFRFDLVGLIDIDTIKAIRTELDKIDPSIILYGEGWSMTTKITKSNVTLATQMYVNKLDGFAMFSDTIRDAIKGSVFKAEEKGYVNGNISNADVIKKAIQGKTGWSEKGSQNIVYASWLFTSLWVSPTIWNVRFFILCCYYCFYVCLQSGYKSKVFQ